MKTRETAAQTAGTTAVNTEPMTLAFDVTVSSVQELSPNFRRITFGGYCLRDFGVHGDTLDLRIKLMIPSLAADGTPIPLPAFEMRESGWYREWLAMDPAECNDNNADTAPPAPARNARYVRTVVPG